MEALNPPPRELAFSEVKLIWKASEQYQSGWRHSRKHFGSASRWLDDARQVFASNHSDNEVLKLDGNTTVYLNAFSRMDKGFNGGKDECLGQKLLP